MTKRGVRIAYRSETTKKEVKMGKVRHLPSVSRMQTRPRICRPEPKCAKPQE